MDANLGVSNPPKEKSCWYILEILQTDILEIIDQDAAGKVRVPFPGSLLHYMAMTKEPLYEHFVYEYRSKNKFDWLGNGRTKEELEGTVEDWSPYIFAVQDS